MKLFKKLGLGLGAAVVASPSFAAVDLTAVTAAGTDAASIGAAVLVVMIGIAAFKWIRRAL